jgi:hypothetical protein
LGRTVRKVLGYDNRLRFSSLTVLGAPFDNGDVDDDAIIVDKEIKRNIDMFIYSLIKSPDYWSLDY